MSKWTRRGILKAAISASASAAIAKAASFRVSPQARAEGGENSSDETSPNPGDVKQLQGIEPPEFRLRVGDYLLAHHHPRIWAASPEGDENLSEWEART
jgi:hypothetical protein